MAIAKGFINSNGVKYRIEAAGTIYDEEKNSIALGENTKATSKNQLVFGKNNQTIGQDDKVEIVGGGDANIPKNVRTLDWQGNQWNAGDINCDGNIFSDNDITCNGKISASEDVIGVDEHGNVISMRDLLRRIAALEAGPNIPPGGAGEGDINPD